MLFNQIKLIKLTSALGKFPLSLSTFVREKSEFYQNGSQNNPIAGTRLSKSVKAY